MRKLHGITDKEWQGEEGASPQPHASFSSLEQMRVTHTHTHTGAPTLGPPAGDGQADPRRGAGGAPAPLTMNAAGLRGARPAAPCPSERANERASGAPRRDLGRRLRRPGGGGRPLNRAQMPRSRSAARFRRVRPGSPGPWAPGGAGGGPGPPKSQGVRPLAAQVGKVARRPPDTGRAHAGGEFRRGMSARDTNRA